MSSLENSHNASYKEHSKPVPGGWGHSHSKWQGCASAIFKVRVFRYSSAIPRFCVEGLPKFLDFTDLVAN